MSNVNSKQTVSNASATQAGLVAASGAQTLAPNITLANPPSIPGATITGGNVISFTGGAGTLLSTHAGAYGTYPVLLGGNVNAMILITSGAGAGETITFPCSVGFPFPATLSPVINTQTIDWTIGSSQIVNAVSTTATLVLSFSNPANGGRYVVETIGLTGRAWTFTGVKWAGGVAPTVTAVTGAKDMFEIYYDGSNYIGRIIAQNVS